VAERARVAASRARRRAGVREHRAEMRRVGADGEADGVGVAGGDFDDARARRRDFDRDLRRLHALEPLEAAREAAAVHRLAAEVSLQGSEMALEAGDPVLALADALHGGVAAADTEDRTAPALGLEGERGRGRHGRIAGDRVGDAGAQVDARGRLRRQHELAPDLRREVLAVGEEDGVETELLEEARGPRRPPRLRHREDAELHPSVPTLAERREVDPVELGDVLAEDRAPLLRDRVAHDARPPRSTRPGNGPSGSTASRPSSRITTPFTTTARMPCASETSRSAPAGKSRTRRSGEQPTVAGSKTVTSAASPGARRPRSAMPKTSAGWGVRR